MNKSISGVLYSIDLDFGLGKAYAVVLDFTDLFLFDGAMAFVVAVQEEIPQMHVFDYSTDTIMGPFCLYSLPKRDKIFKKVTKIEKIQEHHTLLMKDFHYFLHDKPMEKNWAKMAGWHAFNYLEERRTGAEPIYVNYEEIRNLEQTHLLTTDNVKRKICMKLLIEKNENIGKFFDLQEDYIMDLLLQVINTYFSYEKVEELIKKYH